MHITFMVFGSQNFEKFLQVFQYDQPIIHMLWSRMIELIWSLMSKYVSKGQLLSQRAAKKPEEILDINVCNKSNCKKPPLVDFGTRAKMEFAGTLQTNSKKMKFEKECLQFYQVSVQYLLDQLPPKARSSSKRNTYTLQEGGTLLLLVHCLTLTYQLQRWE